MKRIRQTVLLLCVTGLVTACGGDEIVTRDCDEHTVYKLATDHKRIQAPDGLSPLDPEQEMVLPPPSPQPPRPANAPCLDLPPSILLSSDDDKEGDDDVAAE